MQKRNFVGFEELPDGSGIKLYYQFIDKNTKNDLYIQDYHTFECKYVYGDYISILFEKDKLSKIQTNSDSLPNGVQYFRLVPDTVQVGKGERLLCVGQHYQVFVKEQWECQTQAGFVTDKDEFFYQNSFMKNKVWCQMLW